MPLYLWYTYADVFIVQWYGGVVFECLQFEEEVCKVSQKKKDFY